MTDTTTETNTTPPNIYVELQAKIAALQEQAKEQGRIYLEQAATALFAKYPNLEGFRWHQYTPSFNDGDPCTFCKGDVETKYVANPTTNGGEVEGRTPGEDDEDEGGYECEYPGTDAYKKAEALVKSISDEHLEAIYGNGVTVTITREKVDIEEYDCGY